MTVLKHMYADMPRTPFLSGLGGSGSYTIPYNLAEEDIAEDNVVAFLKVPADTIIESVFVVSEALDPGEDLEGEVVTFNEDGTGEAVHLTGAGLDGVLQTGGQIAAAAALPRLPGAQDYYLAIRFDAEADTPTAGVLSVTVSFKRTR